MPRAAIVSPDPGNNAGGVERVCLQLSQALERRGWEVEIVGPTRTPGRWRSRLGLGYAALSRSATASTRAGGDLDLIVTNGFLGVGCPRRTPRIHVYHGTMVGNVRAQRGSLPARERLRRTVGAGLTEALAGRGGARVVCVSEPVAEEVRRLYRLDTDAVIPNGVDVETFAPRPLAAARARLGLPEGGRFALFVGSLEHRKGSDVLLEGAAGAGYELLVAGRSGAPGARHLGVLEPAALADAYAASDCVLFPTRYEGCSLVVLEALACGRPLLSTPVGWMGTLLRAVPSYAELCVEPTVEGVGAGLRRLGRLDSAAACRAAREFVCSHNSLPVWAERWQALVGELLDSSARSSPPMAR
ncbi:MAG TPA: glycosyltransferase family 4 protein [Solirubrobacteraceae bacterium]|nr:glycosyltransferase family 4 protein [Solirubrobacteraceae bacterium]